MVSDHDAGVPEARHCHTHKQLVGLLLLEWHRPQNPSLGSQHALPRWQAFEPHLPSLPHTMAYIDLRQLADKLTNLQLPDDPVQLS